MKRLITILTAAAVLMGAASAFADASVTAYEKGRSCYKKLIGSGASAPAAEWRKCILIFEEVYRDYPTGVKAPGALYSSGRLKMGLYEKTKKRSDAEGAVKDFNLLIREFPKSSLADDSLYLIGVLRRDGMKQNDRARRAFSYLVENYPDSDMSPKAKVALERLGSPPAAEPSTAGGPKAAEDVPGEKGAQGAAASGAPAAASAAAGTASRGKVTESASAFNPATLEDIRVDEGKGVTKVEFILDKNVEYSVEYTESGPRTKSPAKLEISILHAACADGIDKKRSFDTNQLISYKVKRLMLSSGVKAAFKIPPGARYDIKNANGVITVTFTEGSGVPAPPQEVEAKADDKSASLRIVIDPGHGGSDEGAVGPGGTLEKDVTLDISKRLAWTLKKELGAKVWLTRTRDKDLTLEERDAFAVRKRADLFISIHANASTNNRASGIETYYLNNATDEAARRLARRENRSSRKKLSQVEHILSTMLQNYDTVESRELARDVHGRLAKRVGRITGGGVRNRGVRSALFYVLVGAKCPAILVEAAFISNPREEKLLRKDRYQKNLAAAITEGVQTYMSRRDKRVVSL